MGSIVPCSCRMCRGLISPWSQVRVLPLLPESKIGLEAALSAALITQWFARAPGGGRCYHSPMSALVRRALRIYSTKLLRTALKTEHVRRFRDRAGRIG